jgi:phosphatidylglycerophosphatase A
LPLVSERPGAAVWVAIVGGLGYVPIGPGSAGAAAGAVLVVALGWLPIATPWVSALVATAAVVVFVAGVRAATEAELYFGRKDPGAVVVDEVVGQMIALVAAPRPGVEGLVAAYLIFRAFDVIKPFPARRLEHLPGGWGIMLDDVAAGLWSLAAFTMVRHWLK